MRLRPDARLGHRARVVYRFAAILVLGVAVATFIAPMVDESAQPAMFYAVGTFLLGVSWWARAYGNAIPDDLVIEGMQLRLVFPGGRTELLRLEGAVHDEHGLLVGAYWMPLTIKFKGCPRQPLYRSEEIEALKARAAEVHAIELFLRRLACGAPICWSLVLMWASVPAIMAVILPAIFWS